MVSIVLKEYVTLSEVVRRNDARTSFHRLWTHPNFEQRSLEFLRSCQMTQISESFAKMRQEQESRLNKNRSLLIQLLILELVYLYSLLALWLMLWAIWAIQNIKCCQINLIVHVAPLGCHLFKQMGTPNG